MITPPEEEPSPGAHAPAAAEGFDRRRFLGATGKGLAALLLAHPCGHQDAQAEAVGANSVFSSGIASGGPLPNRVILWTRVNPSRRMTVR